MDGLFAAMEQHVTRACERAAAETRAEAEAIAKRARQAREERHAQALAAEQAALAALAEEERLRAEAEASIASLTMRQAVADEVLQWVHDELARICAGDRFPEILERLLDEALDAAPEGPAAVEALPAHVKWCEQRLRARNRAAQAVANASLSDGVIVRDIEGRWRISNTLSGRYAKLRAEARRLCVDRLFGEGGAHGGS